jgi:hypothetical protein
MGQPTDPAETRWPEPVDRHAHDTLRLFAVVARPSGPDREAEKPVRLLSRRATLAGVHPPILGGGMAEPAALVLGGGGMAEQATVVLGGGGMAEQATVVLGGGGMAEQASEVLGAGGIAELENAVRGGGGIAEQEESVVRGDGGMTEPNSAVVGGGGIAEPDSAVLGGGGMTGPSQATSAGSSSGTVQSQPAASGPSSIPLMVRLISAFGNSRVSEFLGEVARRQRDWGRRG